MDNLREYDPTVDILLNVAAVLFLVYRLRGFPGAKTTDPWLLGAGVFGIVGSLLALSVANLAFEALSPRDVYRADEWDSLLFLQIVFGCTSVFALVATVLGLPPMRRRIPWRIGRWLLAPPVSVGATAGWLGLSNAAPLVEDYALAWLHLFGLTLALTLTAVSLFTRTARRWPERSSIVARFGFISAVGAFLLAARLAPLFANAVWNADLLLPLMLLVCLLLYGLALITWLAGGAAPKVAVFLRRFGKTDLNRTIGRAARRRRRRARFRVVTLDDRDFVPQSGAWGPILTGAVGTAAAVTPLAAVAYLVLASFSELFGGAEGSLYGQALVMALAGLLLVAFLCLFPTLAFLGWAFVRSWTRRRKLIASSSDVDRLSGTISRNTAKWQRARALSNPQALVATTTHELWREAVLQLMSVADLVLLDASDLSDSIQWELDQLRKRFPAKAVILVQDGVQLPENSAGTSGAELEIVSYSSYPELEKAVSEIMAREVRASGS